MLAFKRTQVLPDPIIITGIMRSLSCLLGKYEETFSPTHCNFLNIIYN